MLEDFPLQRRQADPSFRTEDLLEQLRDLIVDGSFAAGAKLREIELAKRFSTSRTPIREALVALEREGMVTYELNRGYSVRQLSARDLYETYEMRALLEGYVCGWVARQGLDDAGLAALRACVDEVDALLREEAETDADTIARWRQCNLRFHALLMAQVPSGLLERTHRGIGRMARMHDVFKRSPQHVRGAMQRYNEEHARILEAIVQRDSGRAEFLMREHIMQACGILQSMLTQAGG